MKTAVESNAETLVSRGERFSLETLMSIIEDSVCRSVDDGEFETTVGTYNFIASDVALAQKILKNLGYDVGDGGDYLRINWSSRTVPTSKSCGPSFCEDCNCGKKEQVEC